MTSRTVMFPCPHCVFLVLLCGQLGTGCKVDAGGHFEGLSGGTHGPDSGGGDVPATDGGADGTGGQFPPEPDACVFDKAECNEDVDCCMAAQPPTAVVWDVCPNDEFPKNWSCVAGEDDTGGGGAGTCVQSRGSSILGCSADEECSEILPGYVCVVASGEPGRCAPGCDDSNGDLDCTAPDGHGLPGFICDTLGGKDFCRQRVN